MSNCHFCKNTKIQSVCTICYAEMLDKFDAINIYGLSENDFENLFCVTYPNSTKLRKIKRRYHPNDLYNLLCDLISISTGKTLKDLLKKKQFIDQQYENKLKLQNHIKVTKTMLDSIINKMNVDQKIYLEFYDDYIKTETIKLCSIIVNSSTVALTIFNNLEKLIIQEKDKNDTKLHKK